MRTKRRKCGFTLVEAMVMVVITGIVAVGAGVGLQSLAKTPTQTDLPLAINAAMVNVMEQMKATAFANLSSQATALTNTNPGVLINGHYYSCTVSAALANPDGTGNKSDFMQINVTIGSQTLTTYITGP